MLALLGVIGAAVEAFGGIDLRNSFSLVQSAGYVVGAVVFIRWLLPVYKYLDAVAPGVRRWDPSWALWGWFVPLLWWWRPKQVVNDVWRAGGGSVPAPVLTAWWVLFIAGGLLSTVTALVTDPESADRQCHVRDQQPDGPARGAAGDRRRDARDVSPGAPTAGTRASRVSGR